MLANPCTVVHGAGDLVNPDSSSRVSALGVGLLGVQHFLTFVHSFLFPLSSSPSVFPKRRSQQGVVDSKGRNDYEFIARNSAFYRPKTRSHWTITYHVTNTSLPVWDFSSRHTYIFDNGYFTHLLHLSRRPLSRCPLIQIPYLTHYS